MNQNSLAEQLEDEVSELIESYGSDSFKKYWEYYRETFSLSDVTAFFIKIQAETNYLNFAVIGDGLLIDVDGDNTADQGGISVHPLTGIRSIYVRTHGLPTLSRARNASLVVFTHLAGGAGGPYWIAEGSLEEKELLAFSRKLVELIKSS